MNRVFVVEVSPTTSDDGSTSTFLFSTEAFATRPDDTPANVPVRALLRNPGTVRRELFNGARVTGAITPSYGNIMLANPAPVEDAAGELDDWIDYGISGSRVVVRWGEIGDAYPAAWTTVYIAYAHSMIADADSITIRLRDRLQLLDKPVVNEGFTGAGGIEGNGNVSKRKQFVSQDPGLIPPILVDANRLIYFVQSTGTGGAHDMYLWNAVETNPFDVYDNGVEIDRQAPNYTSAAEMLSTSPSEGSVRYWFGDDSTQWPGTKNGPVYFRLGSPPEGDVRVWAGGYPNDDDAARLGSVYGSFTAGMMALRAGIVAADLDTTAHTFNMLEQLIDDDRTYLEALADAALVTQGFFGFTRLDKFRAGYLLDPENTSFYYGITPGVIASGGEGVATTSLYTFTPDNTTGLRREPPAGMEAPVWSVSISAGQTWPSQLAGGASATLKDYLTREPYWTAVQGVSTTALLANPGAIATTVELKPRVIQNQFSARLMAERYFALFGGRRDFFTFTTPMTDDVLALELHDVVTLQTPRFGLSAGKKYRIVGITLDCSVKVPSIKFTLWGGQTGRYTGHTGGPGTPGYQPPGSTPVPSGTLTAARNSIGLFTGRMFGTVSTGSSTASGGGEIGDFTGRMVGTVVTPDPGLLDDYLTNLRAGYSLNKLSAAYSGPCLRVRRSSDDAEQDIGFVSGVIDWTDLLTFAGAGEAYVTTWYDQAGTGFDLTQATAANQPRVVNAGVAELGIVFIGTNGSSMNRMATADLGTTEAAFTVFVNAKATSTGTGTLFQYNDIGSSSNNDITTYALSATHMRSSARGDSTTNLTADPPFVPNNQAICLKYDRAAATTETKHRAYQNGTLTTMANQNNNGTVTGTFPSKPWYIGSRQLNSFPFNGYFTTMVIYNASLSDSDISAISTLLG